MTHKLVSVIIPCFNAEIWIEEAIESCLNQTYSNIEIVVIDDGSTDKSLDVIKKYKDEIVWETGFNKGANHARNRGLALSQGEFIQLLDADDFLLPEKIERQIKLLEETGADVIYGDVYYQTHLSNSEVKLSPVDLIGATGFHEDYLETVLSYGCMPCQTYLIRKSAINCEEGWDENLKAGQNRDFILSILIDSAIVLYQPGYYSVYRKNHSNKTITSNKTLLAYYFGLVSMKAEKKLNVRKKSSKKYLRAIANSYLIRANRDRKQITSLCYIWLVFMFLISHIKLSFLREV
jgi:glycosyltransferase involved in cell wall biosynthesis